MAQADLLVDLVRNATSGDQLAFRKAAEGLIQEEKRNKTREHEKAIPVVDQKVSLVRKPTLSSSCNKWHD